MPADQSFSARSWLFAPGDSEKKMAKATGSTADIVIFDIEDAVAPENKPTARKLILDFLNSQASGHDRLWVRVNSLDGPHTLVDLAAVMPGKPGGIESKRRGLGDLHGNVHASVHTPGSKQRPPYCLEPRVNQH